ncbi:MAG: DUF4330 domain-containing protein [Clostridia bacterium]|nr:DUF4330 domain-containing protein [Clostridia bacterium]
MNNKPKRKINLIDVIIFISLTVALGAALFGLLKGIGSAANKVTVEYVLEISPIDSAFTSKVAEGNGIYDHASSQKLGTVSAVSASQAYHQSTDPQGSPVSSVMEGSSILYITATADAQKTSAGYLVGNCVLGIGKEIEIRLPDLYANARCISIKAVEN